IYSQDWLEQLSIHEFRHVVQMNKLEKEMPQVLKYILGEHAAALLAGFYMPFWLIEGDAVCAETGLSESGRGRTADFFREYHAQLVEKGKFDYEKAYLGSYRSHVSDHYQLGYLLTAGAREMYNKLVWDSVLTYIAGHPLGIVTFDEALEKNMGLSTTSLYDTVFNNLATRWRENDKLLHPTANRLLSRKNSYFTSYTNGVKLANGSYFAAKTGLADIARFVEISPDGKEKKLFTPGYSFEESVTAREKVIVWSERFTNLRWSHADNSLFRIYDTERHQLSEYVFKSKIYAPAISPDLTKAVVVEADNHYGFYLSEIDLKTGKMISKYQSEGNDYFFTPSYTQSKDHVLTVLMHNNQKGIVDIDLRNKARKVILPFRVQEIRRPIEHEGSVYYIGGYRGTDDLYAIDTLTSQTCRVITSRFGIADYSFDGNTVVYSDYSSDGYRMVKTNLDSIVYQPVNTDTIQCWLPFYETLARQEKAPIDFTRLNDIDYQSARYRKTQHLMNFHSWAPISVDPYNYMAYPGVSVMSQNMLSTSETTFGYRYLWENSRGECYLSYKYLGWFPVFNIQSNYGKSKSYYYQVTNYLNKKNEVVESDTVKQNYSWNELNLLAQVYLPLNLSRGKYTRYLYPILNYHYTYYDHNRSTPERFPQGSVNYVEGALQYYSQLKQSVQSVYPAWGLGLTAGYMHSLSGVLDMGQYAYCSGYFYLPGLFKNHGIKIYGGYQLKNDGDFSLNEKIRFPRGHQQIENKSIISCSFDYKMPVLYPDFSLGRFVYIKRIVLGVFYDQAHLECPVNKGTVPVTLRSTGTEVVFNANFFRFFAPIDIGFRESYLFDRSFKTDFLFSISFEL
ncbi:MAG TPA: hypothetical protein PLB87_10100, partial [Prolixibacteraceae bacterium]|nr:hypothetical protein [Prolixibacteraceae bacterium]